MNDDFISKELALWLKERGCEIKPDFCYVPDFGGRSSLVKTEDVSMFLMDKAIPAYSWYDILVTHAKEFWGREFHDHSEDKGPYCSCPLNCEDYAYYRHPTQVLRHLVTNDTEEAESYVREHSLFNKPL